jgi:preprotein translocase subunit SecG
MTFLFYFSLTLFLLLCAVLCLVILVQESKSLGLGASFGGDPGESLFGTSTADVLKKFTAWLAVFFMVACLLLSLWSASIGSRRTISLPTSIEESDSK